MTSATNKAAETVHVVFGASIAGTLQEALLLLGSTDRVIGLPNSLSVGPIDPPDPDLRLAWGRSVLGVKSMVQGDLDGDPIDAERAWAEATAPGIEPVFWACLRSPMEHACFLAFAARMEGRSFDIVDATDLDFTTADGIRSPWSLGFMRPQDIVAARLYEMRRSLSPEELSAASAAWAELRRENAPFRIVRDGRLVSAPLTHYDALLTEQAAEEWQVVARLIGRAMDTLSFGDAPTGRDAGDVVLFGRVLALGENGALEIAGLGPSMRDYQVRRPRLRPFERQSDPLANPDTERDQGPSAS